MSNLITGLLVGFGLGFVFGVAKMHEAWKAVFHKYIKGEPL